MKRHITNLFVDKMIKKYLQYYEQEKRKLIKQGYKQYDNRAFNIAMNRMLAVVARLGYDAQDFRARFEFKLSYG